MLNQYRGLLIDLFWTTVDIDLSVLQGSDGLQIQANLVQIAQDQFPQLDTDEFQEVFIQERAAIREKWDQGVQKEISSSEKFYQFLCKLSFSKNQKEIELRDLAEKLTAHHMQSILDATTLPPKRKEILQGLASSHPLVLVSNFDHGDTGRRILKKHGIDPLFKGVIISDDVGKRKPHPELFRMALQCLGIGPSQGLMIGDSPLVDIHAANQLGIDTIWINRQRETWPNQLISPTYELSDLCEIFSLGKV